MKQKKHVFLVPLIVFQLIFSLTSCVDKNEEVYSLNIVQDELSLVIGESAQLAFEVSPEEMVDKLDWSSSDSSVAVVDNGGMVISTGKGEAIIEVTGGSCFDQCRVVVSGIPVEEIRLSENELELLTGDEVKLEAEVLPDDAEYDMIRWSSSNPDVAAVDETGLVVAIKEGVAEITAAAGDVSQSCHVSVAPAPARIGDYYYSDGTWSTDLNNTKDVIGIVFWTGDPTADDPILAAQHPECVNGLVVSISGDTESAWQESYWDYIVAEDYSMDACVGKWLQQNAPEFMSIKTASGIEDNLNKIVGYNNTKALEVFNEDPSNASWPVTAVEQVVGYREEVQAPGNSSDWYLPSPKEVSLMITGEWNANIYDISGTEVDMRDLINERLATLDNAIMLSTDQTGYLSSSEDEWAYSVYGVFCYYGGISVFDKGTFYRVRPVLAF